MATSDKQHTCCSCCCGQDDTWRNDVWGRPIWTVCDVVVAFDMSHTTLDGWRGDTPTAFPAPAALPGRLVRWWRDAVLDWFQARQELAANAVPTPGSAEADQRPASASADTQAVPGGKDWLGELIPQR